MEKIIKNLCCVTMLSLSFSSLADEKLAITEDGVQLSKEDLMLLRESESEDVLEVKGGKSQQEYILNIAAGVIAAGVILAAG
ncbi:hypothetical protein BK026_01845 [Alteromonas sp. V450]|uniref:hypothetical protein n=1 Tax=Alteromonas sp. V450 TaxID=1912139 RepID=UPI0008FF192B|nr:hypothetical protein [Alteromonas sp. V450]OJF67628.1 hypothetical protein BK026_01845 [Alteromonas sp. V450]